jgi:hypothetical protein
LRYPHTSRPKNIFSSYKAGRQVCFYNLPADNKIILQFKEWLYARLHQHNVRSLSRQFNFYVPKGRPGDQRANVTVEFETKEIAEEVQSLYKNERFYGLPISVSVSRPPMRYLGASWDSGHNGAHGQPRDYGTAEVTNFESVRVPLAVLFGRRSCTTIVPWPSSLTCIRCRMKCIENGFLGNATGASGWQDISIKSSTCHVINVRD